MFWVFIYLFIFKVSDVRMWHSRDQGLNLHLRTSGAVQEAIKCSFLLLKLSIFDKDSVMYQAVVWLCLAAANNSVSSSLFFFFFFLSSYIRASKKTTALIFLCGIGRKELKWLDVFSYMHCRPDEFVIYSEEASCDNADENI